MRRPYAAAGGKLASRGPVGHRIFAGMDEVGSNDDVHSEAVSFLKFGPLMGINLMRQLRSVLVWGLA